MQIKLNQQKGTILAEFAFIIPVMILIVVGTVEFSILFYNKAIITNASREGARYGIALRTPSYATPQQIIDYTKAYCANYLITFSRIPTTVQVTATPSSSSPKFGDQLTVKVSYTYTDLVLHKFVNHDQAYELTATTIMTYE